MQAKMLYTTDGVVKAAATGAAAVPSSLNPEGVTYNAYACVAFSNTQEDTSTNKAKLNVVAFASTQLA